jgi:hypothetical protein
MYVDNEKGETRSEVQKYKSFLGGLLWARIMTNKEAVI